MLVDAHVHFWDRSLLPYPWLDALPAISGRHLPEDLHREVIGARPDKMVFVECGAPWLDEVQWIEELTSAEPRICAIVAKATVNAGAQTSADISVLRRHPLVRGVRHPFEYEKDPRYCARPEFIRGVRELGAAGLSFDLCCYPPMLPAAIELVAACPHTQFILDHAGKPRIRAGLLDPWREHIRTLAQFPNLVCKFSGLVTEADHRQWTLAHLRPYVDHLLATFGAGRLLFGGDWPVVKLAGTYQRWLDAARELLSALTPEERASIFARNAERIYRV
jgi:L-fuconolactonase